MIRAGWVLAAWIAGCSGRGTPEVAGDLTGVRLPVPLPRPEFRLTTIAGEPFDFRTRTQGRLTLLFYGYTRCPDVCPATMANLGAVIGRLSAAEREAVDVVFVTTDPDRDTPVVVGPWLANFEPGIIGLVGTAADLKTAQVAAGIAVAIRGPETANYTVSHAAQVLVYSPDDSAHIAYPFGTRQAEWAADLPKLLDRWKGSVR